MTDDLKTAQLEAANEDLRQRLEEATATLDAIRNGEVDGLVVAGADGDKVYTLDGAEQPYRVLIEAMQQGAATLSAGSRCGESTLPSSQPLTWDEWTFRSTCCSLR